MHKVAVHLNRVRDPRANWFSERPYRPAG